MGSPVERWKAMDHMGEVGLAERTHSKVVDSIGKAGLAEWETKDSKLAVNYCGDCHGGKNSQPHPRELVGK